MQLDRQLDHVRMFQVSLATRLAVKSRNTKQSCKGESPLSLVYGEQGVLFLKAKQCEGLMGSECLVRKRSEGST